MSRAGHAMNDFNNHAAADEPNRTRRDREIQATLNDHFSSVAAQDAADAFSYYAMWGRARTQDAPTLEVERPPIRSGKTRSLIERFEAVMNDPARRKEVIRDINKSISENSLLFFRPERVPPITFYDEFATYDPAIYFGPRHPPKERRTFVGQESGPPTIRLHVSYARGIFNG